MTKSIEDILNAPLQWTPLNGSVNDFVSNKYTVEQCSLRMNDFPDEPLWTLSFQGASIDFDDAPRIWKINHGNDLPNNIQKQRHLVTILSRIASNLHFLYLVAPLFLYLASLLIYPYRYPLEESIKQINDDGVSVIRFLLFVSLPILVVGLVRSREGRPWAFYAYAVLAALTIMRLVSTYFL